MIDVTKRARPDISLAVAFLTTRVKGPDIDDWRKLRHVIEYLRVTRDLPLILGADGSGVLSWYVDASFAVHPDMRGHTGGAMTMGRGFPLDKSTKHKLNTRSSTESEIVAVNDLIPQILWARLFMRAQGIEVRDNILYQDNKSAMLLETNGLTSSSKRTKHINIRSNTMSHITLKMCQFVLIVHLRDYHYDVTVLLWCSSTYLYYISKFMSD
jgi:hypothetical protein